MKLSKIKTNKKGSIEDLFFLIVTLLGLAIFIIIALSITDISLFINSFTLSI